MNFTDFFTRGLANTLKFKNQANFSYKGNAIAVSTNTVIDSWYLQDFTSANYEITIEYGTDDVEHVNAIITARAGQSSITVYGRTNLGRDIVKFTTTVDNSIVKLIANPFYQTDGVTPLANIRVIYKVTYSERVTRLQVNQTTGETTSLGGEQGLQLNWNGSNLPNGFLTITETGAIEIAGLSNIAVAGYTILASAFILDSVSVANSDSAIAITTNPTTRTLTLTATNYPSMTVTGTFVSTISGNTNTMDNTVIGGATPYPAYFTALTAVGQVNLTPPNANVTISPTGTGRIVVAPVVAGTMDRVVIGSSLPTTATFSSLTITSPTASSNSLTTVASAKTQLLLGAIK